LGAGALAATGLRSDLILAFTLSSNRFRERLISFWRIRTECS